MSDYESRKEERRRMREEWRAKFRDQPNCIRAGAQIRSGGVWTGVFILMIGIAALIRTTNPDLPDWIFSWQTFLIALGFFIGFKHGFRGGTWFILILIGGAFLIPEIYPDISIRRYIWPIVLIIIGAFLIFRPRRRWQWDTDEKKSAGTTTPLNNPDYPDSSDDFVNATSIFGGTKKNIISKNFKGGDLVSIFGGTELDLTRADFAGTATLELTTIFGGTKLLVPANWIVKSDAAVIFGGIEDKRTLPPEPVGNEKILLLKGTIMFGGVDIKSY